MNFDKIQTAVQKGMDMVAGKMKPENDEDLQIYEMHKANNFANLTQKIGPIKTIAYIRYMEERRSQYAPKS